MKASYFFDSGVANVADPDQIDEETDAWSNHGQNTVPGYLIRLQSSRGVEQGKDDYDKTDTKHEQQSHAEDGVKKFDRFGEVMVQSTNFTQCEKFLPVVYTDKFHAVTCCKLFDQNGDLLVQNFESAPQQ
jgi:hypothetical protein